MAYDATRELEIYDSLPASIRHALANLATNVPPSRILAETEELTLQNIYARDAAIRLMIPAYGVAECVDCSDE